MKSDSGATVSSGELRVIGVGASAGGQDALTRLLRALPADTGMAFVLVTHLAPDHVSELPQILSRETKMSVAAVTDGVEVAPNHVYLIPPKKCMAISQGRLHLSPRTDEPGLNLPINHFFSSLAKAQKSRAIGVVLSGMQSDGTVGLQAIKAEGGITFAQDEVSAKYDSMPESAILSGCVDFVLPPEEIASELVRLTLHPQ